jgi:recombination protein U
MASIPKEERAGTKGKRAPRSGGGGRRVVGGGGGLRVTNEAQQQLRLRMDAGEELTPLERMIAEQAPLAGTGDEYQADKANKGVGFEKRLVRTCEQYEATGRAMAHKVPTEWVVRRDHDNPDPAQRGKIVAAFPKAKAICDFLGTANGVNRGRSMAFEAKENSLKTRFPFNMDPKKGWGHEVKFLRKQHQMAAITFMLVDHKPTGQVFLIPGPVLFWLWDMAEEGVGPASIPIVKLLTFPVVPTSTQYPVDFMRVVDDWAWLSNHYGFANDAEGNVTNHAHQAKTPTPPGE